MQGVIDLSRRGFFGATSAALVAMLAPKKAYSFLTANPLAAASWAVVQFPPEASAHVLTITSAEQARKLFGDGRCDHFFKPPPVMMVEIVYGPLDAEVQPQK